MSYADGMQLRDEIVSQSAKLEALRVRAGARTLVACLSGVAPSQETVFVADLNAEESEGYADRYFDVLFGLQRIFARPIELIESQMQDVVERRCGALEPVSMEDRRATA